MIAKCIHPILLVIILFTSFEIIAQNSVNISESNEILAPSTLSAGEILYGYRCKGCHEPATPGAPSRSRLGRMETNEILESMISGEMKIMANNLSDEEMQAIAQFLTES